MNKITWLKVSIISLSIIIAGYFIGNMHKYSKEYDRHVRVKGLAIREIEADVAIWPIYINLTGNNLKLLKDQIQKQKIEVENFFINQGFEEDELDVGYANITDIEAEHYYKKKESQKPNYRYLARINFTINTRKIEKLRGTLSKSLELISKEILIKPKNSWQPVQYNFTRLNEIKPSMIEEATKNAREVAKKFALDSNSKVGKIKSASQGLFSIADRDHNSPHIKRIRIVSTINYFLED